MGMNQHDRFPVLVYQTAEQDITTAGAKTTFNLGNEFNQLPGEYEKAGMRAYTPGAFLTLRINLTSVIGALPELAVLCKDRYPSFQVEVNTPTLVNNHTRQAMNALTLNLINQINNAMFKLFADKVPGLRSIWAPYVSQQQFTNFNPGFVLNNAREYDELDRTQSWHLDNSALVLRQLVGVVQEVIDPIFIPFCYHSGDNRWGSLLDKDVLPLSMVVNNDSPWLITLTHLATQSLQSALDAAIPGISATLQVNARLNLVVSHRPIDSFYGFGLPICNASVPLTAGGTFNPTNEWYRYMGVFPKTDSTATNDAIRLFYVPDDWTANLDTSTFRQKLGPRQVFPLVFSSLYGHMLNAFNAGADARTNPRLWYDSEQSLHTVFKSTNSSLVGPPIMPLFDNALGFLTHFPTLPLINNPLALPQFSTGVLPEYNEDKISIDFGPGLTGDQATRVFGSILSTDRSQDVANIAYWEKYGCMPQGDCKKKVGMYEPCVNNPASYNRARFRNVLPVQLRTK